MYKNISLYIAGQKVDWSKTPDILFTYQTTDYTNPTVVKNSYTKTLNIEGTPNNNKIFSHIWKLDRVMDNDFTLFNPSQRADFVLYNDSEVVEEGYIKLDKINKSGNKISYDITLYGGLGSFFYNLAYNLDTDKEKTLADLIYTDSSDPDNEFDFTINKEAINDAWNGLTSTGDTIWKTINFIPTYQGIPEDFDADRVLINTKGLNDLKVRYTGNNNILNDNMPMSLSDEENTYTPKNGYVTGEMMRECDEWEMADIRSYLQRPAISVKGLINAISNPINNGGYNVVLDPDFFNNTNPYYNSWITLPGLKPETDAVDEYKDWEWYKGDVYIYNIAPYTTNRTHNKWKILSIEQIQGTPNTFQMEVEVHATITGTNATRLYTSCDFGNTYFDPEEFYAVETMTKRRGCMCIQMYGFGNENSLWYNNTAKCGSNVICLTSKVGDDYIKPISINTYWQKPWNEGEIQYNFGYWEKVSGSDYVWHNETDNTNSIKIMMDSNLMSEIPNIGLAFGNLMLTDGALVPAVCGYVYGNTQYEQYDPMAADMYKYWDSVSLTDLGSTIIYKVNGKMRSFQPVTKKDLLGGMDGTPCDWFLSYCKLFGLFIEKDKLSNTIYVKLRNNFYVDETVDLENIIDRSKTINVTPLTFESKWYNFNYNEAEGKYLDKYKNTYSQDFGKQLIDTKFNYDANEIDLLENTKFRNGLTALEKSNYFNVKYDQNGKQIPQCLFNWCSVTYYNDTDTLETNMSLPQNHTMETLNPNMENEFYDIIPKLQMKDADKSPTDGDGVLVFFNGIKNTGNQTYWITDDVEEMFIDSDKPCWLSTSDEWNNAGTEQIAIKTNALPMFTRYVEYDNIITSTFDFGYTKELYVPYYHYDVEKSATIYQNFWMNYIEDLYSINTRKVSCNVALNSNDVYDFLKRFYWFDNCEWVCTKITDYDICLDKSTLCEFTKVNDKANYLNEPVLYDNAFRFYRTDGSGNVPATGTNEQRSVYFNVDSNSAWDALIPNGCASFNGSSVIQGVAGTGNVFKATFLTNTSAQARPCTFIAGNDDGEQITIKIWQDGYIYPKILNLSQNNVTMSRFAGDSASITVDSSSNWVCTSDGVVTVSSDSGTTGTTTIQITTASANNTGQNRIGKVYFNNAEGLESILTVTQRPRAYIIIEQFEEGKIKDISASGQTVTYRLVSDTTCQIVPMGNTSNFTSLSGASYNSDIQPTTGTDFTVTFQQNSGTVSRNASFGVVYEIENITENSESGMNIVYDYDSQNVINSQSGNLLENPVWHNLAVDLTPFKYIRIYVAPVNHDVGLSRTNITSAYILDIELNDNSKTSFLGYYSNSTVGGYVNNDNRTYSVEALVNKTVNNVWQLAFKTESLYGTSSTDVTTSYIYRIEGYYMNSGSIVTTEQYTVFPTIVQMPLLQDSSTNTPINLSNANQQATVNLGASFNWTATTDVRWIKLYDVTGSQYDTYIDFGVYQNNGNYRVGHIFVTYTDEMGYNVNETFTIQQAGNVRLEITPNEITADYKGGKYMVSVSASTAFNATTSADWIELETTDKGVLMANIKENDGYERSGLVRVDDGNDLVELTVTQGSKYGDEYVLDYAPEQIVFPDSGGTKSITIRSDSEWEIENPNIENRISFDISSGTSGETVVTITATTNETGENIIVDYSLTNENETKLLPVVLRKEPER